MALIKAIHLIEALALKLVAPKPDKHWERITDDRWHIFKVSDNWGGGVTPKW